MNKREPHPTGGLRTERDPHRPAVGTAKAAVALGRSRYAVELAVKAGRLPGYGIPSRKRTRWYVYADVLTSTGVELASDDLSRERDIFRARASAYEEVVVRLLAAAEATREAEQHRSRAIKLLAEALEATAAAHELQGRAESDVEEALRQVVLPSLAPGTAGAMHL